MFSGSKDSIELRIETVETVFRYPDTWLTHDFPVGMPAAKSWANMMLLRNDNRFSGLIANDLKRPP